MRAIERLDPRATGFAAAALRLGGANSKCREPEANCWARGVDGGHPEERDGRPEVRARDPSQLTRPGPGDVFSTFSGVRRRDGSRSHLRWRRGSDGQLPGLATPRQRPRLGPRHPRVSFGGGAGTAEAAPLAPATARSMPPRAKTRAAHGSPEHGPVYDRPLRWPRSDGVAGGCDESDGVSGPYGSPRDRTTGTAGREAAAGGARSAGHVTGRTGRTGRTGGAELAGPVGAVLWGGSRCHGLYSQSGGARLGPAALRGCQRGLLGDGASLARGDRPLA
jgi:hypothetical protein